MCNVMNELAILTFSVVYGVTFNQIVISENMTSQIVICDACRYIAVLCVGVEGIVKSNWAPFTNLFGKELYFSSNIVIVIVAQLTLLC